MKKVLSVKDAKLGVAGGSAATTEAMPTTASTIEELKAIVMLTNRLACSFNEGRLNTCILTSYALAASLADLGYADARPVRVEASSSPDDRKLYGVGLGCPHSPGFPRRRARDDHWQGHLAVCIGQSWLLDPTLDQSNNDQWAAAGVAVEPVAASIPPEFWDLDLELHQRHLWVHFSAVSTRYKLMPQKGFAYAPDARPSHWRPLAKELTRRLKLGVHRRNWEVPRTERAHGRPSALAPAT
jgi:hypothetical protein